MESRQGRAAASAGREIRLGEESVDRPPDQPTFPVLSVPSGTTIAPPGGAIAGHEGRTPESRSSMARFRACWVTHVESGCAVTPATCTRREARAGPGRDRRRPRTIGAFSRRHKEATHDEHQADHRGPAHFACRKLASDNIHEPPPFPVTQDAAGSCGWLGPVVANDSRSVRPQEDSARHYPDMGLGDPTTGVPPRSRGHRLTRRAVHPDRSEGVVGARGLAPTHRRQSW